ncbi:MAG TPA: CocE/NonD family hydrolase [Candidatus Limnocylindrales bacterium]|nr:CocE/NonD family hydrolase [Candidatus Limnocylindrales bacterium]
MTDPRPAPEPRFDVAVDWDARIAVRDGVELSANIWRPSPRPGEGAGDALGADDGRFPAILEMIPYGKDNWRRAADVTRGEWFAARGFALCRVDVRGTGSSGGVALDEYTADETRDGYDAVEWLASQPWCSGSVGMWGISYGGFTSIQVAALRPPHLRAIVPVMATDDRYLDDIHYRGGCVTVSELSQYAVSQVAMNAMPPDASFRGAGWRYEWRARLDATPPWLFAWLQHQADGPYWRQGSLAPAYDAIESAIFNIGGWHDSYVDPAFRMQALCPVPSHTLVGNWVHSWPHAASPGPNLDELHEIARFFDRHLNGVDNGWDDEPSIVWFEHEYAEPEPFPASLPGRWRAAPAYPHPDMATRAWRFGAGVLSETGDEEPGVDNFRHRPTTGTRGPLSWGAGGSPNGLARDLRPDEAAGPTYTSEPLDQALEVLGVPVIVVHVEVDAPVATLSVRLSDVAPDGTSALVSAGVLNLTHRRSHDAPLALQPDMVEEVRIPLRTAGYRWQVGHRLRVSIASSLWPVLWPSPYPATFAVHRGGSTPSRLELPVIPPAGGAGEAPVPAFRGEPPELRWPVAEAADGRGPAVTDPPGWRIEEDVPAGSVTVRIHDGGEVIVPDGRRLYAAETLTMTAWDGDPARAELDADVVYRWQERDDPDRPEALTQIEIRAICRQTSTVSDFELTVRLEVDVDGVRFFERDWHETMPRELV